MWPACCAWLVFASGVNGVSGALVPRSLAYLRLRGGGGGDANNVPPEVGQIEAQCSVAFADPSADGTQLAACIAGEYDAHPSGALIKAIDLHFERVATEFEDVAIESMQCGDLEEAQTAVRSASEARLRGACRLRMLLLEAMGVGAAQRWYYLITTL